MEYAFNIVTGCTLDSLNCSKRDSTLLQKFSWESSKTFKTGVFSNIPWNMHEVVFFRSVMILNSDLASMIKWFYYRLFPSKFPTSRFSWCLFWLKFKIQDCRFVTVEKKREFSTGFFGNFEILESGNFGKETVLDFLVW